MKHLFIVLVLMSSLIIGCKSDDDATPQEAEDLNLGGETSIGGSFIKIFEQPATNLSPSEIEEHHAADVAFGDIFVTAPSTINGGLGPIFNQNSCENCHVSNGRSPFPGSSTDLRGLLIRLSVPGADVHGEPLPVPNFGGQLQTKALFGIAPEAQLTWHEEESIKTFLDGEEIRLARPVFSITASYSPFPANALLSPRLAPPVIGLGLLEAINEADILANADPNDTNADGISGKPNLVWNYQTETIALGRFGWKAGQPTLLQQTAAAYNQDMGITSPYFPKESSFGQIQLDTLTDDPEIDEATLLAATFYAQSLAVPKRRNTTDPTIMQGRKLFFDLQCDGCHRAKYVTGAHPDYAFLSYQTIFPYTDLLLHDMGEGLADNRPDFEATGNEWRTPPLWGVGLAKIVGGANAQYLHDGRAKTLAEAIMWHGGEAENSKEKYRKLPKTERIALVKFLESL